jgi:hypothetical protein
MLASASLATTTAAAATPRARARGRIPGSLPRSDGASGGRCGATGAARKYIKGVADWGAKCRFRPCFRNFVRGGSAACCARFP